MLTDNPKNNEIVKRILNAVLLERHHGVDDFSIFDFEKRLASFYQVFLIMKVIVGLLAGISLLVGGVGIMNIMLVSVSERVREIGIRKALGASPADIGRQFVVEAMLLSGFGGTLGAALGMGGTLLGGVLIHHFKPSWQTQISEPAVTVAVVSAVVIGLVFGYWPAKSASRLDPVTAIRTNN
jgi:putative ABC transport system permease protein